MSVSNWSEADKNELKKFERKAVEDQRAVVELNIGEIDVDALFGAVRHAARVKVTTDMVEQQSEFNSIARANSTFCELLDFGTGIRLPDWMRQGDFLKRKVNEFIETECTMEQGNQDEVLKVTRQLAQMQHKARHQLKAAQLIGSTAQETEDMRKEHLATGPPPMDTHPWCTAMEQSLENEYEEPETRMIDEDLGMEMGENIVIVCPYSQEQIKKAATAMCPIHFFDYDNVKRMLKDLQKRNQNDGLSCPVPGCRTGNRFFRSSDDIKVNTAQQLKINAEVKRQKQQQRAARDNRL